MNAAEMKSLEEVRRAFSTQRKCEAYLKRLRWPNGVTCPRCGAKHPLWIPSTGAGTAAIAATSSLSPPGPSFAALRFLSPSGL